MNFELNAKLAILR